MLFYGAALVACPAVTDETTILFNVTIAYILYFYVCLMYNKAICLQRWSTGKCVERCACDGLNVRWRAGKSTLSLCALLLQPDTLV